MNTLTTSFDMSRITSESTKVEAAIPLYNFAVVLASAERELAAFYAAVTATYGQEQADLAALDWLKQMERADWPAQDRSLNWRSFTFVAATKLAERVCSYKRSIR